MSGDSQGQRSDRFRAAHPYVRIWREETAPREWRAAWLDSDSRPQGFGHAEQDRFLDLLEARFSALGGAL